MTKLLVTGATGHLGRQTIEFLRQRVADDRIVALARDPEALSELAASGIEIRRGDYFDQASLVAAFAGVEKILLVSAVAFTDRLVQHRNVIAAAKQAGVRHVVYTSIQRRPESPRVISMVTESDIATENALKESGLDYTILFNSLYLDSLGVILGETVLEDGIHVPGGSGKGALVARRDLAEANAVILTQGGHENKSYVLGASEACSFADIATALSIIAGRPVSYTDVTRQDFIDAKVALGLPQPVAAFLSEWVEAVAADEFSEITHDLERIIGHKPTSYKDFLEASFAKPSA